MKTISFVLLLLSFSLLSCESDPDIMNDDAPPALFVWGYVDMQSGKHQVRIRRAIQEKAICMSWQTILNYSSHLILYVLT
ncbi:MAG: hypothetical protein U9N86_13965 [Bacteroidota bacterium]|nr:hypothetical protein [Bacteroidota bacterium]